MGKKFYVKVLCLCLTMSMLTGLNGCAMLLQNMRQQSRNEAQSGDSDTNGTMEGSGEQASNQEQSGGNTANQDANAEPAPDYNDSVVEDVLQDKKFQNKLELIGELVDQCYLNGVSAEAVQEGMFRGLLAGLGDPYSCYYTAEEYAALMESTNGIYCGIGALVQQNINTMLITIVKPFVDGPAYKAGMLPGDIVYMVDEIDVTGMNIDNVVAMMKGEANTIVKVTVLRGSEQIELVITRDFVEVETITHEMLENQIGLITISEFDEVTIQQFKDAIDRLQAEGAKGYIIDLRGNPGGLVNVTVDMLDYLLPKGLLVYTEDKYGQKEEYSATDDHEVDLPIVVLINENSASASEIFAAAMQDYEAATIVGTTSFGKGIVQSIYPVSWLASTLGVKGFAEDGSAVKVTISTYYTPNGRCIHGTGITPDVEVELEEELKQQVVIEQKDDNQLQKAIEILQEKIK